MAPLEMREIRTKRREYSTIDNWRRAVIDRKPPSRIIGKEDQIMRKSFGQFIVKGDILFPKLKLRGDILEQLVFPKCDRQGILQGLHFDVGHTEKERTLKLMRERFVWPCMRSEVEMYVDTCDRCIRRKSGTNSRAPLVNVHTTFPLELVCFDFLTLDVSKGCFGNVMVITDHVTKFSLAVPTRNKTARTTAEAFFNECIIRYGIPCRLSKFL